MKTCTRCGEEKVLSEFHKCARYGHQFRCKSCRSIKKPDPLAVQGLRKCTRCDEVKVLDTDFHERKKGSGLYRSQCKPCHSRRNMETRDPERVRAAKIKHQKTDKFKDRNNARSKAIYWSDPEYYSMKQRARNHGVPVGLLKTIAERDEVCQMCGSDQNLQYDHLHPRSEGGKGSLDNLQLLCQECNVFKSNHLFLPDGGMMINAHS